VKPLLLTEPQQDALIEELRRDGVTTVRLGFGPPYLHFIMKAHQSGIGSVVIIYPNQEGSGAHTRPADPGVGIHWAQAPLTDADPEKLKKWLSAQLATLEATGAHLTAFEVGNEINGPFYNGDFLPKQASGRQLGVADLNNRNDPEGSAIAKSFTTYLNVVAAVKEVRDQSKLNHATPIISAGLASAGTPGKRPGQKLDGVAVTDTLKFMQSKGLDHLVEGYGVHAYTAPDPNRTADVLLGKSNADAFAACTRAKPCWLTEWGYDNNSRSCPINEQTRIKLINAMRGALEQLAAQGRLAASIYYSWGGPGEAGSTIFRCGSLTEAGKLALQPLN
jgi:hypothetical protein